MVKLYTVVAVIFGGVLWCVYNFVYLNFYGVCFIYHIAQNSGI